MENSDRTAFVDEVEGGPGRLSGLFMVHCELKSGEPGEQGPHGVPISEAIEWGRARAAFVSVVIGYDDPIYSAGAEPLPGCIAWPEEGIDVQPRPHGFPPGVAVNEVEWMNESTVSVHDASPEDLHRLRSTLEKNPRVSAVTTEWIGGIVPAGVPLLPRV